MWKERIFGCDWRETRLMRNPMRNGLDDGAQTDCVEGRDIGSDSRYKDKIGGRHNRWMGCSVGRAELRMAWRWGVQLFPLSEILMEKVKLAENRKIGG